MPRILFLLAWLAACPAHAHAGDWPNFRGPTHDGHAAQEKLADTWQQEGPPVVWSRSIGKGYSAMVVVEDRVYTQEQTLYQQALLCLDANTGETLWSHRYAWPFEGGGLYPGPRATPAVAQGRVYYAAPDGLVGCVSADTGKPIWSHNFKEKFDGHGTDFGVSASPLIWEGKLIIPVGGEKASLIAVDAATGDIVWKCGELPASYATPIVVPYEDRHLVIAPLENSLLCADANSGEHLWELDLSSGYDEHSAAPLYRESRLMIAGPFRSGATQYELRPSGEDAKLKPHIEWFSQQMSNDIASSVLVEDHLYGFDLKEPQSRLHRPSRGHFRCLSWNDGHVAWSSEEPGHANLIFADGKLLMFNDRGELLLCRVTPDRYEELARCSVFPDDVCWTPPALAEGRVYLRTHSQAVCLDLRPPKQEDASTPATKPTRTVADIPRPRRFDPTVLLGGEREFPAATPDWSHLQSWYLACLALLGSTALITSCIAWLGNSRIPTFAHVGYWSLLIVAGMFGSALLNPYIDGYLFTWPLAVWAVMQLAVQAYVLPASEQVDRPSPWRARIALVALLAISGLYFHGTRMIGLAPEWAFLAGPVVAAPVAMLLTWLARRQTWARFPWPGVWLLHAASFTLFYWAGALLMKGWIRLAS